MERFESAQQTEEGYRYFTDPREREDIYNFCRELTEYVEKEDIENIFFLDRSARPAWIGLDQFWNQNYKDKPKPGIYFINPEGAPGLIEELLETARDEEGFKGAVYRILQQDPAILESDPKDQLDESAERFKQIYTELIKEKDRPLLVFDTCSHTGLAIRRVLRLLEHIGFSDVRVITANSPEQNSGITPSAYIDGHANFTMCQPFGGASLVEKTEDLLATPTTNWMQAEAGRGIRKEIRQIIKEHDMRG